MKARLAAAAAAAAAAALLSGCALDVGGEVDRASRVARYATSYDHEMGPENNLLDRALADCPEKTAKAEALCVRDAVDGAHLAPRALMALVPGCRAGQLCHYDHTTRDRLGFIEANATDYVKRWRVELDFRTPTATVPIAVTDRDDFEAAPPAKAPG